MLFYITLTTFHENRQTDGQTQKTCAAPSVTAYSDLCAQRRFRSDCAFAQSNQHLHRTHFPIYGIVRMCVPNGPLFQLCQVYDWPPFFNKKYMNDSIFLDSYVKGPIFLTSWYMHIIFAQRFFEAACSLGIQ